MADMKALGFTLFLGLNVVLAQVAVAGQATPEEARELALKAADFLRDEGPEKAWAAFGTSAAFHDRDLYVTVVDSQCQVKAHGAIPILIGKRLCGLQDIDGKPFIWEMSNVTDRAWIDYKWQNPITKAVVAKTAYVVRVGDYVIGVGAYK
ncbi:MAG TPA: cache domain-containing protein [Stellaceae bacterium]|nr:cache domain-containing protein [Stellaceae bacterium]